MRSTRCYPGMAAVRSAQRLAGEERGDGATQAVGYGAQQFGLHGAYVIAGAQAGDAALQQPAALGWPEPIETRQGLVDGLESDLSDRQ